MSDHKDSTPTLWLEKTNKREPDPGEGKGSAKKKRKEKKARAKHRTSLIRMECLHDAILIRSVFNPIPYGPCKTRLLKVQRVGHLQALRVMFFARVHHKVCARHSGRHKLHSYFYIQ